MTLEDGIYMRPTNGYQSVVFVQDGVWSGLWRNEQIRDDRANWHRIADLPHKLRMSEPELIGSAVMVSIPDQVLFIVGPESAAHV